MLIGIDEFAIYRSVVIIHPWRIHHRYRLSPWCTQWNSTRVECATLESHSSDFNPTTSWGFIPTRYCFDMFSSYSFPTFPVLFLHPSQALKRPEYEIHPSDCHHSSYVIVLKTLKCPLQTPAPLGPQSSLIIPSDSRRPFKCCHGQQLLPWISWRGGLAIVMVTIILTGSLWLVNGFNSMWIRPRKSAG